MKKHSNVNIKLCIMINVPINMNKRPGGLILNSCQPLWKGSQTPSKWALFLGVGEYNQGLHTGDFGFKSVFSDSQCHDYDSNSGTYKVFIVLLSGCSIFISALIATS